MLGRAAEAMRNSYAPYSNFKVGAAVLGESGKVYAATNVENASYGLTICAERAAIFRAVSEGERRIVAVAVVCDGANPCRTCGACLQVISEFSDDAQIFMLGKNGKAVETSLRALLPNRFTAEDLLMRNASSARRTSSKPKASNRSSKTRGRTRASRS
jgi:cytidine deaminase